MGPIVLIVASRARTFLGLAQAMRKFGYQTLTRFPDASELALIEGPPPSIVVVRPPSEQEECRACLELIRALFLERGVPVVSWVSSQEEAEIVRECLGSVPVVVGEHLLFNELYAHIQTLLKLPPRHEMRIMTGIAVEYRASGLSPTDRRERATVSSLSMGGCFIRALNPYPLGTAIELVLPLGSGATKLAIFGKVCRHGEGDTQQGRGMGVMFTDLSEGDRAALERFIMNMLDAAELASGV